METGSLKEKIINLRKNGKSYNEISKKLKCSKSTISFHCKNENLNNIGLNYKNLTELDIEEIKEFYKENTLEETSLKFGISKTTVKKYTDKKMFIYENEEERRKSNYNKVKRFRKKTKLKAVEYKGGSCEICNYNKCIEALEFHHLDPKEKDFGISANTNRAWKKIEKELDKCILVCSNCHREIHSGVVKI